MRNQDLISNLPQDAIFKILLKLNPKYLLVLRCVSKLFSQLISHHEFLKLLACSDVTSGYDGGSNCDPCYLVYYESTDYTKQYFSFHGDTEFSSCKRLESPFKSIHGYLRLVGSCHGLICLFDTNYFTYFGTMILWNPAIRKFKILPDPQGFYCFKRKFSHMAVVFGFDRKAADFKVVQILHNSCYESENGRRAMVCVVKDESWRRIQALVPGFLHNDWSGNAFVNDDVHWLAYTKRTNNGQPNCIMSFNVTEEVFKVIDLPQNLDENLTELCLSPSSYKKSLGLFIGYCDNAVERWDIWRMNEYGKMESWVKKFSIVRNNMVPLKFLNKGDDLLQVNKKELVLDDLKTEQMKKVGVSGLPSSFYTAGFVPNLALLDDGRELMCRVVPIL